MSGHDSNSVILRLLLAIQLRAIKITVDRAGQRRSSLHGNRHGFSTTARLRIELDCHHFRIEIAEIDLNAEFRAIVASSYVLYSEMDTVPASSNLGFPGVQ